MTANAWIYLVLICVLGITDFICAMSNADLKPQVRGGVVSAEEFARVVPYLFAVHPNKQIIAAAMNKSADDDSKKCLGLYNAVLSTPKLLQLFKSEKTKKPTCMSYSSKGVLAVGNTDGNVQLWYVDGSDKPWHVDPDNKYVACVDIPCGRNAQNIAWNKDGSYLAVTSSANSEGKSLVTIIDAEKRALLVQFRDRMYANTLCYRPGQIEVLTTLKDLLVGDKYQSVMNEWAIERNKEKLGSFIARSATCFVAQNTQYTKACYNNNGSILALAGASLSESSQKKKEHASIYFVDMTKEERRPLDNIPGAENEHVVALAYAPCSHHFVCCTNRGIIALYNEDGRFKDRVFCMKNGSSVQVTDCVVIKETSESLALALATAIGLQKVHVTIRPDQKTVQNSEGKNFEDLGLRILDQVDKIVDFFNPLK